MDFAPLFRNRKKYKPFISIKESPGKLKNIILSSLKTKEENFITKIKQDFWLSFLFLPLKNCMIYSFNNYVMRVFYINRNHAGHEAAVNQTWSPLWWGDRHKQLKRKMRGTRTPLTLQERTGGRNDEISLRRRGMLHKGENMGAEPWFPQKRRKSLKKYHKRETAEQQGNYISNHKGMWAK